MTQKKKLKARVRERMARTGERYTTARAAILGELRQAHPPRAHHDQTFALRRVLAARGTAASEATLLGLGGGIGVQVFTFQYKDTPPLLYVGTRCAHQYAYDPAFLVRALTGLGLEAAIDETGSAKKAAATLDARLADGPVVAWVGLEALHGQAATAGATPWVVVVHDAHDGPDGRVYAVECAEAGPLELSADTLAAARKAVKKQKHRLLSPLGEARSPSAETVAAAVRFCVDELDGAHAVRGHASSFGLAALSKWAKAARSGAKTGWRRVFSPGPDLLLARVQAHGWIGRAAGGGAFRGLHADFLRGHGASEAAAAVSASAAAWTGLARWMLDPGDPVLAAVQRDLAGIRWPAGPTDLGALGAHTAALPDGWGDGFYGELGEKLDELVALEHAARDALARVD